MYIYYADADTEQWVDASPDSWDPTILPDPNDNSSQSGTLDDRYLMLNAANDPVTGGLNITGQGNVGIGTSNPAFPLEVNRTDTGTVVSSFESATSAAYVSVVSSSTDTNNVRFGAIGNDAVIQAGASEAVRITSDGNVGIGSDTPDAKLVISEPSSSTTPAKMKFLNTGDRGVTVGFNNHDPSPDFCISSGDQSTHFMTIDGDGKVGIGVTNPSAKLQIQSSNSDIPATGFAVRQNNSADTAQTNNFFY